MFLSLELSDYAQHKHCLLGCKYWWYFVMSPANWIYIFSISSWSSSCFSLMVGIIPIDFFKLFLTLETYLDDRSKDILFIIYSMRNKISIAWANFLRMKVFGSVSYISTKLSYLVLFLMIPYPVSIVILMRVVIKTQLSVILAKIGVWSEGYSLKY